MRKKFRQLSLQAKMSSIFVLANLVVFAVTVILLLGINSMSSEIDKVYQGNLRLNEVSDALMAVQDSMTDYLNSKTSDSLEECSCAVKKLNQDKGSQGYRYTV